MADTGWQFDAARDWPARFGRNWLWTMLGEPGTQARAITTAKSVGCTDLIVLANDPPAVAPTFSAKFGAPALVAFADQTRAAGMDFHLSSWLDPKAAYVDSAANGLADLVSATKAKSVCLDLEGEWRKRISNHSAFVAEVMRPAFKGFSVPIGITSFAKLPSEVLPALAWALEYHNGYGQPQAYSVSTGKSWQFNAALQPDRLPGMAWDSWSPVTKKLVCLLAAWGSEIPGRAIAAGQWTGAPWGVAESVEVAAAYSEAVGFRSIGWWSEEALSSSSSSAALRRAAIAQIRTTGKSVVRGRRTWLRRAAWATGAAGVGYAAFKLLR